MRIGQSLAITLIGLTGVLAFGQENNPSQSIVLPRPAGIDDATWARLQKAYQKEKERFLALLVVLDRNRFDPLADTPLTFQRKKKTVGDRVAAFSREILLGPRAEPLCGMNAVWIRNETSPRLTGRVLRIGPGGDAKTLKEANPLIRAGDLIRLGEGTFNLGHGPWTDIAILGLGPEKTQLRAGFQMANRVRIEGVGINSGSGYFTSFRNGGGLHLKNCRFLRTYGGGNRRAIVFGCNAVVFAEGCTFEERGAGESKGTGAAFFHLVGVSYLLVKDSEFIDGNPGIRVTTACVLDRCSFLQSKPVPPFIVQEGPGSVFLRDTEVEVKSSGEVIPFTEATDDPAFIAFALGERGAHEDLSGRLAETLRIEGNLPYWIGLLRHEDEGIRSRAARKVEALAGEAVRFDAPARPLEAEEVDRWIRVLDHPEYEKREAATRALMKTDEKARDKIRILREEGTLEQRIRAGRILACAPGGFPWPGERAYARWMRWFVQQRLGKTATLKAQRRAAREEE
ncbi:MAG: right-handed parallel beta-helix repeat-containing protein [Planctomycetota bacterium]|jgi:hypothetical protein